VNSLRLLALLILGIALTGCRAPSSDPLERALRSGNHREVGKLLEQGTDVNRPLPGGESALLIAIKRGDPKTVALLLERQADIKVKDDKGRDLFEILWGRGHPSGYQSRCIGLILKAGHQLPKTADKEGQTWMHRLAAACNEESIPSTLVEQGFPVDGRDQNGWTPLHHAVFHSRYFFCLGLLNCGADVNAQTEREVSRELVAPDDRQVLYRYMAGSQPLDLERQTFTRATVDENIEKLLTERGATKNPQVKNQFR